MVIEHEIERTQASEGTSVLKRLLKPDIVGAVASGLCALHCLATPFLFFAQSYSATGACESGPIWWSVIDYLFIGITFFAVYHSGKNSSKSWLKYALFTIWGILSFLVLNEKVHFLNIAESWKYLMAFGLISLHLYNLKFCTCHEESCCVTT